MMAFRRHGQGSSWHATLFLMLMLAMVFSMPVFAEDATLGADVEGLLDYARLRNPEYAATQAEAAAATERAVPAGALPDPRLRVELMDLTRMGEQSATILPGRVGSTRYLLMQDVPWFGKLDLKREIAELEADGAKGRANESWADIAGRIKVGFARLYYLQRSEQVTLEILELMARLEKVAQARYASGLAAPQDVIRAQLEQTALRNELIGVETERDYMRARLNALLSRASNASLQAPTQLRKLPTPAALDFSALENRVRSRNPQLYTEEVSIQAAEKNRQLTYRNRYPDVTLGVSPVQYQNAVKEWQVMVELNIPLQQSSRRAQERASEAMLEAARQRREAAANRIIAELAEGLAGINAARRTEQLLADSLLPQLQLAYQAALAAYENGKMDFATLLDAQRQIRVARLNTLKAQVDARMRLAEVERLLGEDL